MTFNHNNVFDIHILVCFIDSLVSANKSDKAIIKALCKRYKGNGLFEAITIADKYIYI